MKPETSDHTAQVSLLSDSAGLAAEGSSLPSGPSRRRKLAFWLLLGMFSVVCVEVPAGSTMFPFFTIWGVLVVWPLYLLHTVFLAGLVFRWSKPGFWSLYSAGTLFGMYEAYITKVVWTSFRPEGPIYTAGGIALPETIILVLYLHPLLAFVIPLLLAEITLTSSHEVFLGLPPWVRKAIGAHPTIWAGLLMVMFGLMQFVNSPSVLSSLLSGAGNGLVLGLAVFWWRRTRGNTFCLRELLPGNRGLKALGYVLLAWYLFWGFAIKAKSIPAIFPGQLTVWIIYAVLLIIFRLCLLHSRQVLWPIEDAGLAFRWRGFWFCVGLATAVTALARLWLHGFVVVQITLFFSVYMVLGFVLLVGAVRYASKRI